MDQNLEPRPPPDPPVSICTFTLKHTVNFLHFFNLSFIFLTFDRLEVEPMFYGDDVPLEPVIRLISEGRETRLPEKLRAASDVLI